LPKFYDEQWQGKLKSMTDAWGHMRCLFADILKKKGMPKVAPSPVPTISITKITRGMGSMPCMAASGCSPVLFRIGTSNAPGESGVKFRLK
jgi:hypothetical protein